MSKINKYLANEVILIEENKKRARVHTALAFAVLAGVAYLLINDKIDFGHCQKIKAQNLSELVPRVKYVLQHSTPGVFWLLFCTFYVVSKRVNTPAVNPNGGHEHLTQSAKNIFLNSLEQFVMSFTSQLILITYLSARQVLNLIPILNILFLVGRIFFWLGYPMNRGFGMTISFVPICLTIAYISYRYLSLFF